MSKLLDYERIYNEFTSLLQSMGQLVDNKDPVVIDQRSFDVQSVRNMYFLLLHDWPAMGPSYFSNLWRNYGSDPQIVSWVENAVFGAVRPPFELEDDRVRIWCDAVLHDINPMLAMNFYTTVRSYPIEAGSMKYAYKDLNRIDDCGPETFIDLLRIMLGELGNAGIIDYDYIIELLKEND